MKNYLEYLLDAFGVVDLNCPGFFKNSSFTWSGYNGGALISIDSRKYIARRRSEVETLLRHAFVHHGQPIKIRDLRGLARYTLFFSGILSWKEVKCAATPMWATPDNYLNLKTNITYLEFYVEKDLQESVRIGSGTFDFAETFALIFKLWLQHHYDINSSKNFISIENGLIVEHENINILDLEVVPT